LPSAPPDKVLRLSPSLAAHLPAVEGVTSQRICVLLLAKYLKCKIIAQKGSLAALNPAAFAGSPISTGWPKYTEKSNRSDIAIGFFKFIDVFIAHFLRQHFTRGVDLKLFMHFLKQLENKGIQVR